MTRIGSAGTDAPFHEIVVIVVNPRQVFAVSIGNFCPPQEAAI
jgi:hypothetical protein